MQAPGLLFYTATAGSTTLGGHTAALTLFYTNRKAPVLKTILPDASLLSIGDDYDYTAHYCSVVKDSENKLGPLQVATAYKAALPRRFQILILKDRDALSVNYETESELVFGKTNRYFSWKQSFLIQQPRNASGQKSIVFSTVFTAHSRRGKVFLKLLRRPVNSILPHLFKNTMLRLLS